MRIVIPAALLLISLPIAALAFKEGPYPNVTGGFGDQSCHLCHLDNPINAPGGSLTVEGVPPLFVPGDTYRVTVTISRDGLRRGGFEIAARFAGGKRKGRQAGAWRLLDDRAQLISGAVGRVLTPGSAPRVSQRGVVVPGSPPRVFQRGGVVFVQHNLAGSRAAAGGSNGWTIEWIAPASATSPVQFNVAANASNNDDSPLGDYIYLKTLRSAPQK
jgi:hypothetical protein